MSLEIKEGTAEGTTTETTTPAEASPGLETQGADTSGQTDGEGEVDPASGAAPVAPAAYTPNLKFKVLDKEHEFDPFFKDVIKDEVSEKKIREIYEKAYGLDVVKPKFQSLRQEHEQLSTEHQGLVGNIQELREHYQKGDFDSFFGKLKIPFEKVLQYVAEKIQYQDLPPEQRQVLDARRQAEQRAEQAQKQLESREQMFVEQQTQAKGYMLDLTLERADVRSFAEQYQARTGKSFRDAVIDYGEAAYFTRKDAHGNPVDLTPEQAITELMGNYGKLMGAQAPAAQAPAATAMAPAAPAPKTPVIPNVSGRQTSPTGSSKPKSIEDLKKLHAQMTAQ